MRSVCIFLHGVSRDSVLTYLDSAATRVHDSARWYVGDAQRPVLYITVDSNLDDFESDDLQSASAQLGGRPELLVMIDVSGRYDGYEEVISFTQAFLVRFNGVAQDDHSSRSWTQTELLAERATRVREFFCGRTEPAERD